MALNFGSDSQLPCFQGTEWWEEAGAGHFHPPDRWDSGEMVSPEGALAKQNRVLWGSEWVSCYVLWATGGAPAVQLRSVASSGQFPWSSSLPWVVHTQTRNLSSRVGVLTPVLAAAEISALVCCGSLCLPLSLILRVVVCPVTSFLWWVWVELLISSLFSFLLVRMK